MKKAYLAVEGHGEVEAASNLIVRLSQDIGVDLTWSAPLRPRSVLRRDGLQKAAEYVRRQPDAGAFLILLDADEACPKDAGPKLAGWLKEMLLPFPAAVVLLKPEYEVLFLPCLARMAGQPLGSRPGLLPTTRWDGAGWESRRGIKEWLSANFPSNKSYKPTFDQLPLTRLIDFPTLRAAGVPCFGTLERALRFLGDARAPGSVYP